MKKIWLVPALLALVCLSAGCGSRKDGRVLQSPEHTRTVEDYSAFIEETPLTETEMKAPGTETESVVLQTEIETESEQIPETESETERQMYSAGYDFSDGAVKDALLLAASSEGDDFEDRTEINDSDKTRTRTIRKGVLSAVLHSTVPGRESGSVEIVSTDQNLLMEMVKALGIAQDESGYSNLFNGIYDGENAGYIGLKDIARWQEEDGIHLRLTRPEEKAKTMEWEEAGTSLEEVLPDSILIQELRTEGGLREIIQGVEYSEVIQKEFSLGSPVIERDQSGEVITAGGSFHAVYAADDRNYEITTDTDTEGKTGFMIVLSSEKEITDEEVLAEFEHIYQSFYNGVFTEGFDSNEVCAAEHAQIEKHSQNSFTMKMF